MAEKCRNRGLTEILWRLVLFMKYCGKKEKYRTMRRGWDIGCTCVRIAINSRSTTDKFLPQEERMFSVCLLMRKMGLFRENSRAGLTVFLDFFLTK